MRPLRNVFIRRVSGPVPSTSSVMLNPIDLAWSADATSEVAIIAITMF